MCNIIGTPDDFVKLAQAFTILALGIALAVRIGRGRGPLHLKMFKSMIDLTADDVVKKAPAKRK